MDLPLNFYIVSAIAIIITGISKSGFAGGLGVMTVPIMSLFISPQFAVAILIPILLAMDIFIIWHYRKTWHRALVFTLIPGAAFGVAIGAMTFQFMDANFIKFVIGVLSLIFVGQYFLGRKEKVEPKPIGKIIPFGLASLSGFAGFVAHAGGPPVKGLLLQQQLDKSTFVGTNGYYIFFVNIMKLVTYISIGQMTFDSLKNSLILSPMLLVGIAGGTYLHKIVDPKVFIRIVYILLSLAGLKLLWDSVPNLSLPVQFIF